VEEFDAHQLSELLSEAGLVDVRIHGLRHGPRIAAWELAHGSLVGALIASISGEPSPPDADLTDLGSLDPSPIQDLIAIGRAP